MHPNIAPTQSAISLVSNNIVFENSELSLRIDNWAKSPFFTKYIHS
jgi:hypothetical protein